LTWNYTASNATYSLVGNTLNASGTVQNLNSTAASAGQSSFEIAWFLSPNANSNCSNPTLNTNTAYFVGADYLNVLNGWSSATVSLPLNTNIGLSQNPGGSFFSNASGWFCLWAWVDDLGQVGETDEDNNVMVYSTAIYKNPPVGVTELDSETQITTYPNPAVNQVQTNFGTAWRGKVVQVRIYDTQGKLVKQDQIASAQNGVTINVSEIAQGNYVLRFTSGSLESQQKLVIIRN
jgi:hypothetical protein